MVVGPVQPAAAAAVGMAPHLRATEAVEVLVWTLERERAAAGVTVVVDALALVAVDLVGGGPAAAATAGRRSQATKPPLPFPLPPFAVPTPKLKFRSSSARGASFRGRRRIGLVCFSRGRDHFGSRIDKRRQSQDGMGWDGGVGEVTCALAEEVWWRDVRVRLSELGVARKYRFDEQREGRLSGSCLCRLAR